MEIPMTDKASVYDTITNKIIASIEADPGKWQMPWHRSSSGPLHMPKNAHTGNHYRGINIVALWVSAETAGYSRPLWGTYRQWAQIGAQVRKGEKASPVIFYKEFEVDPSPDDANDDGKRRVARASSVFNVDQVDDGPADTSVPDLGPIARNQHFDDFVASTGARIVHGGAEALYMPSTDSIRIPDESRFFDTATSTRSDSYAAVLAHELGHWTAAKHRLNRDLTGRFGTEAYAAEELVAELTSAFICAAQGITCEPRQDHAQYIANWLKLLKSDNRAIFAAAAKASQAADYLQGLPQPLVKAA
jgi:antirestriction protein ArdC